MFSCENNQLLNGDIYLFTELCKKVKVLWLLSVDAFVIDVFRRCIFTCATL